MRYLGGKSRIAGWVAEHLLEAGQDCDSYLEPFVGSGAVFARVRPHFKDAVAADAHPDLIAMWRAVAEGWDPPDHVTREDYQALRSAEPSAWRGLVGFGASFGGKWFGGYVDTVFDVHHQRDTKPYLKTALNSVQKLRPAFASSIIQLCSYADHSPRPGTLVYCDPPYRGTTPYSGFSSFDHDEFWRTMESWSDAGAVVVVSEETAPEGWEPLAVKDRKSMLRVAVGEANTNRREVLWVRDRPETEDPAMATRNYPRLSIEEFGVKLLDLGDLDPVYVSLCRVEWPEEQRSKFLVAYWCLYHVGLSCWLSDQSDEGFWRQLKEAAVNDRPSPVGGRWPRAAERRHWRGANALKSVEDLTQRYDRAQDMVDWITRPAKGRDDISFTVIADRVQQHVAFGPWIAFKVADMLERCCEVPVLFGLDDAMYDSPRQAALRLFRERIGAPPEAKLKDEDAAVAGVVAHLIGHFKDHDAPPGGGRKVGYQEVETILCKWQSHMNGHYPVGNDLVEIAEGLEAWAKVSPSAKEFLHHLPDAPTEADSPVS